MKSPCSLIIHLTLTLSFLLGINSKVIAQGSQDTIKNIWTWVSGSDSINQPGVYGTKGVPDPANIPGGRIMAQSFIDSNNNLWLFGGAAITPNGSLNDLWKYDIINDEWTWVNGASFADQAGVYGTKGVPDPVNVPGARFNSSTWTDKQGNLWLFGGNGPDFYRRNDLWKYDINSNQWTWISGDNTRNHPGVYGVKGVADPNNRPGARSNAISWMDKEGDFWLFGGEGYDSSGTYGLMNDLWKYNIATNQWTWISGAIVQGQEGVYGLKGVADSDNHPGVRAGGIGWIDHDDNLWLFGGISSGRLNDLWKYDLGNNLWTWVSGSNFPDQAGVYGRKGIPDPANVPGARWESVGWIDDQDKLWLFGGSGYNFQQPNFFLNDLWKYDPATDLWTWMGGSNSPNQTGVYGSKGVAAPTNHPGSRLESISWKDKDDNFWLFGGAGYGENFLYSFFNDLWRYTPSNDTSEIYTKYFVSTSGNDSNSGTTWSTAFRTLQKALSTIETGQIWVAKGTYYPDEGSNVSNNDRSTSFHLINKISVYGGFAGYETILNQRNWRVNETILSGEIQQDNDSSNNAFHVVVSNQEEATTLLDGFTVMGGFANGSDSDSFGGGLFTNNSLTSIVRCSFINNHATNGGGIFNGNGSSTTISNCIFIGNSASKGGGISNLRSDKISIINSTVSGNHASGGGGIFNDASSPIITNCIIWGNSDEISNTNGSSPIVTYSIVEGGYNGIGNKDADPLFVDFEQENFHLLNNSPAINAGNNSVVTISRDLDKNRRIINSIVDMGSYENQTPIGKGVCCFTWQNSQQVVCGTQVNEINCQRSGENAFFIGYVNDCSVIDTIGLCSVIPGSVDLEAKYIEADKTVLLSWQLYNEQKTSGYYIQRSRDGANFKTVGFKPVNTTGSYNFIDNYPLLEGYYKLVWFEKHGFESNKALAVALPSTQMELIPNPSFDKVRLLIRDMQYYETKIAIYDNMGRLVQSKKLIKGQTPELNISSLAPGVYYMRAEMNGKVFNEKMLKK